MGALAAATFFQGALAARVVSLDPEPPLFPLGVAWSARLPAPPATAPGYDDQQAYVPLRNGQLAAVSLRDGSIRWLAQLATTAPPVAGAETVFIAVGTAIHALQQQDGRERWRTTVGGALSGPLFWDNGWLIASLETAELVALRGDNGQEIWRTSAGGTTRVSPSIDGDRLYAALEGGRIAAFELGTGGKVWERSLGDEATGLLPLADHLFAGSRDNFFYAITTDTGRIRWRWRTGGDIVGAPTVDESRVYFVSLDNVLRALDRRHGAQRWKQPLQVRPSGGPLRVGTVLLVSGLGPEITGYSTRSGAAVGRFMSPSELAAPPHVIEGLRPEEHVVYLLTGEGGFHAVRHMIEPRIVPLDFLPGSPVPLLPPPPSLDHVPGTPVPIPPPA